MPIDLTEEQRQAVVSEPNKHVRLIDPRTKELFVLVRAAEYDSIQALLDVEFDIRDAYPAQFAAAMRAGWDDPAMSDYDRYDEAFAKLCQSSEAKSS